MAAKRGKGSQRNELGQREGQSLQRSEDRDVIKAGHLQGKVLDLNPADLQEPIRIPNTESPSFNSFKTVSQIDSE